MFSDLRALARKIHRLKFQLGLFVAMAATCSLMCLFSIGGSGNRRRLPGIWTDDKDYIMVKSLDEVFARAKRIQKRKDAYWEKETDRKKRMEYFLIDRGDAIWKVSSALTDLRHAIQKCA